MRKLLALLMLLLLLTTNGTALEWGLVLGVLLLLMPWSGGNVLLLLLLLLDRHWLRWHTLLRSLNSGKGRLVTLRHTRDGHALIVLLRALQHVHARREAHARRWLHLLLNRRVLLLVLLREILSTGWLSGLSSHGSFDFLQAHHLAGVERGRLL